MQYDFYHSDKITKQEYNIICKDWRLFMHKWTFKKFLIETLGGKLVGHKTFTDHGK